MTLQVRNLSRQDGVKWVLRDVELDVANGEVLGLLGGENNTYSALFDFIGGFDKGPGTLLRDGRDITSAGRPSRGVHYRPERQRGFFSRFAGRPGPVDAKELTEAAKNGASAALLGRPFRSLARSVAEERMLQLRQLSEDYGMTVVAALDNFEEAAFFCDRIAVFDQGRIVQTGTPEDVYLEPATPASAAATGRINLLQVRRLTSSKSEHPEYKSLTTEHHFRVKKMELSKVGALNKNVLLGIRPEHISLSFGASFPEDNLIKAAISRVRFLGPSTLVEVEAEGLKLSALVQRLVGLSEGDECMLGLPPDRIHIFA